MVALVALLCPSAASDNRFDALNVSWSSGNVGRPATSPRHPFAPKTVSSWFRCGLPRQGRLTPCGNDTAEASDVARLSNRFMWEGVVGSLEDTNTTLVSRLRLEERSLEGTSMHKTFFLLLLV